MQFFRGKGKMLRENQLHVYNRINENKTRTDYGEQNGESLKRLFFPEQDKKDKQRIPDGICQKGSVEAA